MRSVLLTAGVALALATAGPVLAQAAKPAPAPATQSQAAEAAESIHQIQLTPEIVDHYLAAKKDIDGVLDKMPDGADAPDPATLAKLDAVAKAHMFADYKDYDAADNNIGLVLAGVDPTTKTYIGPEAAIAKQIAAVEADKQLSAKDKKDTIDQLKAASAGVPKLQFPSNVDVVMKHYDQLSAAVPQD